MIDAKELMIGNWVLIKGIPSKVLIFSDAFICEQLDYALLSKLEDAEPIPLTEEILLDCGFEKINSTWKMFNGLAIGIDLSAEWRGNWLGIEMEYLHQLQNLYFALTNKELIYNPK